MEDIGGYSCFLTATKTLKKEDVIAQLTRIRGVGEKVALQLYAKGARSIRDVTSMDGIAESIRLYATYIDDIERIIPNKVVENLIVWLEAITMQIGIDDKRLSSIKEVLPVGAYRRGRESSHDIDVLFIYESEGDKITEGLMDIINKKEQFKGVLAMGKSELDFLLQLDGYVRVVEIYLAPSSERGSALIHTTGPREFGVALRELAKAKGMKFSQHGLVDRETKISKAQETERLIFEVLGINYINPSDRDDQEVIKGIYEEAAHVVGRSKKKK